jgi:hypothetical protein
MVPRLMRGTSYGQRGVKGAFRREDTLVAHVRIMEQPLSLIAHFLTMGYNNAEMA